MLQDTCILYTRRVFFFVFFFINQWFPSSYKGVGSHVGPKGAGQRQQCNSPFFHTYPSQHWHPHTVCVCVWPWQAPPPRQGSLSLGMVLKHNCGSGLLLCFKHMLGLGESYGGSPPPTDASAMRCKSEKAPLPRAAVQSWGMHCCLPPPPLMQLLPRVIGCDPPLEDHCYKYE